MAQEQDEVTYEDPDDSTVDLGDYLAVRKDRLAQFTKESLRDAQRERARRALAVSSVPSTPKHISRDGVGIAVRRGAHRPAYAVEQLRHVRDHSMVFKPIHIARNRQVRRLADRWNGEDRTRVGLKVVHKDWDVRNRTPPEGFERFIDRFERILWCPSPKYGQHTLGDTLSQLEEDLLTINQPVLEVIHGAGAPDNIVQWRAVDGGQVWPTLQLVEHWWDGRNRHGSSFDPARIRGNTPLDKLAHVMGVDLYGIEYALVREGQVEALYPRGVLQVRPWLSRTDVTYAGWQPSVLEEAIDAAAMAANAIEYTAVQLSTGFFADFILGLPDAMHDDDIDAFVDMVREAAQGVRKAGQPIFVNLPAGPNNQPVKIDLRQPFNEMGFQGFLSFLMSTIATGYYRMHASTIGARPWDGGQGAGLSEGGSQVEQIGLAKEEGLQADMQHHVQNFLNPLAQRVHPDLRVVCWYGDFDEGRHAQIISQRVQTEMTVNEARIANNQMPLGFWLSDDERRKAKPADLKKFEANPYNHPGPYAQQLTSAKISQDAQQMMHDQQLEQMGQGHEHELEQMEQQAEYDQPAPDEEEPMDKAVRTLTVHVHDTEYP